MPVATETAPRASRLDEAERRTLRAMVRRVLPSDDGLGAAEAGCPEYVVDVVDGMPPKSVERVRRGLRLADDLALQASGSRFAEAEGGEQDLAFRQLQLIPHPTLQSFVHWVVNVTLQGFLGDPRYGGNCDEVGWRFLERSVGSECTTS